MPRRRNELTRTNAMETEDINAPLMSQMKGLTIKLIRVVVDDISTTHSVALEPIAVPRKIQLGKRTDQPTTKETDKSSVPLSDEMQLNATASTSQQPKRRGRPPTKKTDESSVPLSDEMQPNATASTSQQAMRRGRQPTKSKTETKKRALRSNSSIDEVSFESPERRTKRIKRNKPPNNLEGITSESTDDEQVMVAAKNNTNVTLHRREINSRSTDEDDSMSRVDNESMELTHSDANESMSVPNKMVHSTMVHDKTSLTHLDESENDLTPLLSEEIDSPESNSQNSSPKSVILFGHETNTVTQNTMDKPMEETPRNTSKTKEDRKEKMKLLKSTFGKVGGPSTSIDSNRNDPEKVVEMSISSNRSGIVNETVETTDDEQSEDDNTQKKEITNSSGSVFDTPDEMESDDVETDAGGMNISDENVGETSAMSIEENNNMKTPSKHKANVIQSTTAHQENIEENIATASKISTTMPKNVLNELSEVLKVRNERKRALDAQSVSVYDAVPHEFPSDLSTMVKNFIDNENDMMADKTDKASHNEADDVDMMYNRDAENSLKEPIPNHSALNNFPLEVGKKRRMPAAPTPYRKINKKMIVEISSNDEEPGPSTSATETPVQNPKNKRKLPPIDVSNKPDMPGPFKIPDKIPKFTRHGFLEETFFEPPPDGIFIFNAKPNELNVAMDSFNPKKRQRIIEIEPDEVIVIQRSKKRPKSRTAKKISKRRASD